MKIVFFFFHLLTKERLDPYFTHLVMYCTQSKKRKRVPLIIPVTQFRPRNARNCILESPILSISRGSCLRAPPRSSCLRYSTFAPAARKVHVRQLNHCIRYFQMLPKTLHRASANCWTKKSIYLDPCLKPPYNGHFLLSPRWPL